MHGSDLGRAPNDFENKRPDTNTRYKSVKVQNHNACTGLNPGGFVMILKMNVHINTRAKCSGVQIGYAIQIARAVQIGGGCLTILRRMVGAKHLSAAFQVRTSG